MPWVPLAILLIIALTAAALALILFPPADEADVPAVPEDEEALPADDEEPDEAMIGAVDAAGAEDMDAGLKHPPAANRRRDRAR